MMFGRREGEVLLLMAQEDTDASRASRDSSRDSSREGSGVEPALRHGGLRLPGLKYWRLQRGLNQVRLAERVNTNQRYISRVEAGERGCNPNTAQKLAEVLEVDIQALRTKTEPEPVRPRIVYGRVHRTYLEILLERTVGSAYTALGQRRLELHCRKLPWDGVLEVVSKRKRETEVLREILRDPDLNREVRLFLEAAVGEYPNQDIRILAAARSREESEKGRQELSGAMQELI